MPQGGQQLHNALYEEHSVTLIMVLWEVALGVMCTSLYLFPGKQQQPKAIFICINMLILINQICVLVSSLLPKIKMTCLFYKIKITCLLYKIKMSCLLHERTSPTVCAQPIIMGLSVSVLTARLIHTLIFLYIKTSGLLD